MKHALMLDGDLRRFALVFEIGDDLMPALLDFAQEQNVHSARLYGIGGFSKTTLGYYNLSEKRYEPIEVNEQVELVSMIGNITLYQDQPKIHAHCVVGHRDGHTTGGHLIAATVCPTLELMLEEHATPLRRSDRPEIGIPLIDL